MTYDGNVAFKVTWIYNTQVGDFNAPCDPQGRLINIAKEKKVWCSHDLDSTVQDDEACACKTLYDKGSHDLYKPKDFGGWKFPCYDAEIFFEWRFNSGFYHHGGQAGERIPFKHYKKGKWAFFTSKSFGSPEEDRRIIGCYKITGVEWDANMEDWFLIGKNPKERFRCRDLNKAPRFWDFHQQKGGPRWGTGLFRYLPDEEVNNMLMATQRAAK